MKDQARYLSSAALLSACLASWTPLVAGGAENADQLQEVVVTAQKVTEDVRKVPASISVISAADIAELHMIEIADLTRAVPNLSFTTQGGPGNQNIELRGISSAAGSATVSVYLDDVPMTVRNLDTEGQAEPGFFDVQRVEVLRGPQGTLYGASSEGGTIRYISTPVNLDTYSGSVYSDLSATRHGGTNYTGRGIVNIPLIEGALGLRAGVVSTKSSGYVDHYNPDNLNQRVASGVNGIETTTARVAMEWRPAEGLVVKPSMFYQYAKSDDLNVLDLGSTDLLSQHKRVAEPGKDTLLVPSVTVNYGLQAVDLTSVSSYFYRYFDRQVDGTFYNSGFFGSLIDGAGITGLDGKPDGTLVGNVASPVRYRIWTQQFTQEFRLASRPYNADGPPVTWITGVFYSHQKIDSRDFETAPGLNSTISTLYGPGALTSQAFLNALGNPPVPVFPNDTVYLNNKLFTEKQYAVFGEATYHVTSALRLTAGLRYLSADTSLLRVGGYYFAIGSPPAVSITSQGKPTTPKFALAYDIDADTALYATISKGFRLGGPNRPLASFCPVEQSTYAPDSLWNYETGLKSLLMDGRLSVTTDVFYIKWKNIQVDINLPCTFDYNTNAGAARSYGSEAELKFKPSSHLTLGASGGYTNATFTQNVSALSISSGQQIPGVPRWSADLSARFNAPVSAVLAGFASADWNYVGASHGTVGVTDPDYLRPSYTVAGVTAGANYGRWEFSVFVKNLFNDQKIIQRPNLQTVNRGYTLVPRTIGISAFLQM